MDFNPMNRVTTNNLCQLNSVRSRNPAALGPAGTAHATLRDLAAHRVGIDANLPWTPRSWDTETTFDLVLPMQVELRVGSWVDNPLVSFGPSTTFSGSFCLRRAFAIRRTPSLHQVGGFGGPATRSYLG